MILFLDIDGVLMKFHASKIGETAKEALRFARDSGLKFVLHSTWRHTMLPHAHQLFEEAGFTLDGSCSSEIVSKREAIIDYLTNEYGDAWPRALVVDDDKIEPIPGIEIQRIDSWFGLQKHNIREWLDALT